MQIGVFTGFNSQRDGILPYQHANIPGTNSVFQFPTGWNSTYILKYLALISKPFQFPTGWNSTLYIFVHKPTTNGFNSQRDGILPENPFKWLVTIASFNSQRDGILRSSELLIMNYWGCFNSQRDGILQSTIQHRVVFQKPFQFPTGWNSTDKLFYTEPRKALFQFPTGWNSTRSILLHRRNTSMFQFPTGWNSTRDIITGQNNTVIVSIPNGMEFYPPCLRIAGSTSRFNSQRDGILLEALE